MRRRAAFTLVELLVVVAIIGILVAMLMPAIQAARESARRSQCSSHLRNLAQGIAHHVEALGIYPSGGGPDWTYHMTYRNGIPMTAPDQHGGWGFQVLPYIEAEQVWIGGNKDASDIDRSIMAISTPNPLFFCPSTRRPEAVSGADWYTHPSSGRTFPHAKNDYVAGSIDADSGRGMPYGVGPMIQWNSSRMTVTPTDIRDGASNTLLLGEKRLNLNYLGTLFTNDNEGYTCGWNHDTLKHTNIPPLPNFYDTSGGLGEDRFGSSHPGGLNIVMCDSSVHFVTYSIEQETFRRLGNRDDGLTVDVPD